MSIFSLPSKVTQLESSNAGIADFKYTQYAARSNVINNGKINTTVQIPFSCSSTEWWLPARSYIRLRCSITDQDGKQLSKSAGIAPNMNLVANLFDSADMTLNNKKICSVDSNLAQIDILEQRLHKSKAWLDSVGASSNFLQEDLDSRISDISSANVRGSYSAQDIGLPETQNEMSINQFTSPAVDALIPFTPTVIKNLTPFTTDTAATPLSYLKAGNLIKYQGVEYKICSDAVFDGGEIKFQTTLGRSFTGALDNTFQVYVSGDNEGRGVAEFEVIWQPKCLPIFKYAGALPVGDYQLNLKPQNINQGTYAIESILPKVEGVDFKFNIEEIYLYVAKCSGPRVEDKEYFISLNKTNCNTTSLTSGQSLQKNYFNVSSTTNAISIAVQKLSPGDSTLSPSRFRSGGDELSLNRMFLQYANKNFPSPDADPEFKAGVDYTTQRYIDTQINSGAYFSEGGSESILDWQKRGSYHHFLCPKDGQDRSTQLTVNTQFSQDLSNSTLLVFDHSTTAIKILITDAQVRECSVIEL